MSNVVDLPVVTTLDLRPEKVLKAALEANLDSCVIIGYSEDGNEYFVSSIADGADVNWLLDRAKHKLMASCQDEV